jgi:hypothetical protein
MAGDWAGDELSLARGLTRRDLENSRDASHTLIPSFRLPRRVLVATSNIFLRPHNSHNDDTSKPNKTSLVQMEDAASTMAKEMVGWYVEHAFVLWSYKETGAPYTEELTKSQDSTSQEIHSGSSRMLSMPAGFEE